MLPLSSFVRGDEFNERFLKSSLISCSRNRELPKDICVRAICEKGTFMNSLEEVVDLIENSIRNLRPDQSSALGLETPLIGSDRVLDSMNLVELCLILEDAAFGLGFSFDWTSSSAMSQTKSMFRNISTLAETFFEQMNTSK